MLFSPPPSSDDHAAWWIVGVMAVAYALPLVLVADHYFFQDDFMLFYHYGGRPLGRIWEFFGLQSLFFYRPLGFWSVAALYRIFGLNPIGYNLLLAALAALSVVLFARLARCWLRWPGTLLAVGFCVAAGAVTAHLFLWTATLPSAVACCVWLWALRAWDLELRRERPRAAAFAGFALALIAAQLMKESYVTWSALLLVLTVGRARPAATAGSGAAPRTGGGAGAAWAALGVFWLVAAATAATAFGSDATVNPLIARAYSPVAPSHWPWQLLQSLSAVCLPAFLSSDWHGLPLEAACSFLVRRAPVLPVVLLVLAAWKRDRVALFGLAWAVLALTPSALTPIYLASRYLHAASFGLALAVGALGQRALAAAPSRRAAAVAVALATAYLTLSLGNMMLFCESYRAQREDDRRLTAAFRSHAPAGETRGIVFVVAGSGTEYLGMEEHCRLALGRDDVSAVPAEDYEDLNAHSFYTATYPVEIRLIRDGRRYEAQVVRN